MGDMDLHLFDLILKGKVSSSMRVLDAGCGSGRNLIFFLNEGFDVQAIDKNPSEVKTANFLSRNLAQSDVCIEADLSGLPFADASFELIVCSRVLHFADSVEGFFQMIQELRRVLASSGLLYISVASQIGMEQNVESVGGGKYQFPDGSVRFTLTTELLDKISEQWAHEELPRTVLFDKEHAETTLVLKPR